MEHRKVSVAGYHVCIIVMQGQRASAPPLFEETFALVRARDVVEAEALVRRETTPHSYFDADGEQVRWTLHRIVDIAPVLYEDVDDFTELYSRHFRDWDAYRRFEPLLDGSVDADASAAPSILTIDLSDRSDQLLSDLESRGIRSIADLEVEFEELAQRSVDTRVLMVAAASALCHPPHSAALRWIPAGMTDPDAGVRVEAYKAVPRLDGKLPPSVFERAKELMHAAVAGDRDEHARSAAIFCCSVSRLFAESEIVAMMSDVLGPGCPPVVASAALGALAHSFESTKAIHTVGEALSSPEPEVRSAARHAAEELLVSRDRAPDPYLGAARNALAKALASSHATG